MAWNISVKFILYIPSVKILFCDIDLWKARDDKILILAAASDPFKSEDGLDSAYPSFLALYKTLEKFSPVFSIVDKI